jgi:flavin reductase (DIM6/NTAB) family NADH-FMN oxidoreductase RutF
MADPTPKSTPGTTIDPASLPPPERYKLLIGGIVPRPIAFVSTCDALGRPNLAPFSFFAGVGSNPMTLLFCPANAPDGTEKDTLRNAKPVGEGGLGEFVVNIAPESIAAQLAACAEPLPFGESEFTFAGLTAVPSVRIRPPRVAQATMSFECVTRQVIRTNPGQPAGGNIVLGEVVMIHGVAGLINERHHVDPAVLDAFGRLGGTSYCTIRDRFDLPMGAAAIGKASERSKTGVGGG